jgi:hypothetical protein
LIKLIAFDRHICVILHIDCIRKSSVVF